MKYFTRGSIAALAAIGLMLGGCGSSPATVTNSSVTSTAVSAASSAVSGVRSPTATSSAASSTGVPETATVGTLTVFAAASLKATFTTLGNTFKSENPGSDVTFSFAGSSDLVTNLIGGAPADVFAAADLANMTKATDGRLVAGSPVNFATNTLTIVTPPDNPKGITTFADLAKAGVAVVVCAPKVPCGAAAQKIETSTGTTITPVSEESSVVDVLGKVESGEADAGLVYVTDAIGAGPKVKAVAFPESSLAVNTYPIAVLQGSTNAGLAQRFVDLVIGSEGQAVLKTAGFAAAP